MLMALFQNKESLSSNKTTRLCGQADINVQLQARPRGLIGVRREINLPLHPIAIRRLTIIGVCETPYCCSSIYSLIHSQGQISLDGYPFAHILGATTILFGFIFNQAPHQLKLLFATIL